MENLLSAFVDRSGPLGLTRDFFFLLLSVALLSVLVPTILLWLDRRKWRSLRRHLGVMISYYHGKVCDAVKKIPDEAPGHWRSETNLEQKENPLNSALAELQRDIGLFGFCMNADIANKVGAYWKEMNYLWFWVEYNYAGELKYARHIDAQVKNGRSNPFDKQKEEIVGEISKSYRELMDALGTDWYYWREWEEWKEK